MLLSLLKLRYLKKLDKQELDRLDLDVKLKKKIDEYSTRYQTELERKKEEFRAKNDSIPWKFWNEIQRGIGNKREEA